MSSVEHRNVTGIVSLDGTLWPWEAARIPVLDRGFLYGDAVFEALRTYHGEPDALTQHLLRLQRSSEILGFTLPVSVANLALEVRAALAALPPNEYYVRIMVTRGDGPEGLAPQPAATPRRIILVRSLSLPPASLYVSGIRVRSYCAPVPPLVSGAKPAAYLSNLLALAAAQRAGDDDALLLGAYGELLEAATSSLFIVKHGALWTPPLSLGILPGITRDRVCATARQLGLSVRERLLTIHDAYRAEELFFTSSVREVIGAVAVDGVTIGEGVPGALTRRVAEAYRAERGLDRVTAPR